MQTAASLPVLLLGLPAGALADILDRRKLLIFWQAWMLIAALLLSVFGLTGALGPILLLSLTFLLNVGTAMNNPAWQAIVPELVPRAMLSEAISLNSAVFNLARVLGPAFGGMVLALFADAYAGAAAVFFINALSFLFVIYVLYRWKRKPLHTSSLPAERFIGSLRAGVRYVRHAPDLQIVLLRTVQTTTCASALWALLAVVAKHDLRNGAFGYGMLNASLGFGAVMGATLLPRVRNKLSPNAIISTACAAIGCALLVLAFVHQAWAVVIALMFAGFAWTSTTSTFNIAVQLSVPPWVQARALGTYQMVFQGGLALGSALWGGLASHFGTAFALSLAAAGLFVGIVLSRRIAIHDDKLDLTSIAAAGLSRSVPAMMIEPRPEEGPVLISITYTIDPNEREGFVQAIDRLKTIRLRDGAMRWGLFRDPFDPRRYVETFLVDSWSEYMRQRERFTVEDLAVREHVQAFQKGEMPPPIYRMIYTPTD
jgi:MFS family permease